MSDEDEEERGPIRVTFRDLTPANEPELRRLNSVIFPIRYSVSTPFAMVPKSPKKVISKTTNLRKGAFRCTRHR